MSAACGAPDPWAGSYEGESVIDGRDCTTGELVDGPVVRAVTVRVERGADGLFINARCLLRFEELSTSSARLEPGECESSLDDGTPIHIDVVNGRARLDGDELALDYALDARSPVECVTATYQFVGYRQ